jgi:putative membrane protein
MVGLPLLACSPGRRFPLTRLLCCADRCCTALLLIHGGPYTYSPRRRGGFWLQDVAGARSAIHCDRLGHCTQGFVPAILAPRAAAAPHPAAAAAAGWSTWCSLRRCLRFSAFFELIEWWAALVCGGAADAFLATQGDVWDTQWDMFPVP